VGNVTSCAKTKRREPPSFPGILIKKFFGQWKSLFGICHGVCRGELKQLGRVICLTITLTNWDFRHRRLRQPEKEKTDESNEEEEIRNAPVHRLEDESSDSDGNQ
jgi:hypothetical protein